MIFVINLRLHEGWRSPVLIWLCLWFFSISSVKSLKIFTIICKVCLAEHLKAYTKGLQRQFPQNLQFCVFFVYLKSGLMNIFYQQAPGRTQKCLTVQEISGNSTGGNVINLARKIAIFFVTKHYVMKWNFAKIYIWACENLAIFPSVFSFRLTSFSGVEGLLIKHKNCIVLNCPNTPFQITILRSYRVTLFVLHVDTFKARNLFAPRSCAVEKPFGAFLKRGRPIRNTYQWAKKYLTYVFSSVKMSWNLSIMFFFVYRFIHVIVEWSKWFN